MAKLHVKFYAESSKELGRILSELSHNESIDDITDIWVSHEDEQDTIPGLPGDLWSSENDDTTKFLSVEDALRRHRG